MSRPEIECLDCQGHGTRLVPGTLDDAATCPACNGKGTREMTFDEEIDGMKEWNRQEFGL